MWRYIYTFHAAPEDAGCLEGWVGKAVTFLLVRKNGMPIHLERGENLNHALDRLN